ncbi:MAG: nucleoside deaminase [Candidatus Tectomicrobia bacterium]|uniref:tRNA-specific adenosine deaminase n=1 Tax=Tectimicrobiota bacterium TaxID=2528274 RepID=A0A932GNQ5_UNCTE|nr:nucleoside deaminase [Candidatus Tectomicrobia bacterium]
MDEDSRYMEMALEEARQALAQGEVPVGAVAVLDGSVVGRGHNRPIGLCDPTAHAEIQALRQAAHRLGSHRLPGSTLYVTLEPCLLCAGALIQARVRRLVFGASDAKAGAVVSLYRALEDARLNHQVEVTSGVLAVQAEILLKDFFAAKRRTGDRGLL